MLTGQEFAELFTERLFSENETGTLTGLEFAQKIFNARKNNERRRIVNAESQAQAQISKANKWQERYEKTADRIKREFGGDIDKALEANPRLKGTYASGPHREALEGILNGQKVRDQKVIRDAANSARIQTEAAADQVHNYGRTRSSVRQGSGNTFNNQGRTVTVREGSAGDASIRTGNYNNGDAKRQTEVISSTNKRRVNSQQSKNKTAERLNREGTNSSSARIKSESSKKAHDVLVEGDKITKNNWFRRNKKALLIGAGVTAAAGAGYGAYRHYKNKKKDSNKED